MAVHFVQYLVEEVQSHLLLFCCVLPKSYPTDSAHPETMADFTLPSMSFYFADGIASKNHSILETISTLPLKGTICVGKWGMSHRFLINSRIELSLSIQP
jgi:hypothetical protein